MTLPNAAGIGFKPEHFGDLVAARPDIGFIEIHAENYMGAGGQPHAMLERLRRDLALSVHGVGLSIGGAGPLDAAHLARLARLCARYEPESVSEHLAWSSHGGAFFGDLLPLPYDEATLAIVCAHVDAVQCALRRRILLENPASYLAFDSSTLAETAFLAEVAARTGCGLLLDLNNVFVSAINLGGDPSAYLDAFPLGQVGEIHLAGHAAEVLPSGAPLLIDAHDRPVAEAVWHLLDETVARTGPVPVLIERDDERPPLGDLLAEAARANLVLARARTVAGEAAHALAG